MSVPNAKWAQMIVPAAIVDNASATAVVVDTQGFDYAEIAFCLGASDIAMTALRVLESDDNSTNVNISGTIFGTAVDIDGTTTALPSNTDDNKIEVFNIDLRNRKRYLQLVATAGDGSAGTYMTAICRLSRAKNAPITSAGMGAEHVLEV